MDELFDQLKAETKAVKDPLVRTTDTATTEIGCDLLPYTAPEKEFGVELENMTRDWDSDESDSSKKGIESLKKPQTMPTKAQQKLFELPAVRIQPFRVRIKRDDLEKLRKSLLMQKTKKTQKRNKSKEKEIALSVKVEKKKKVTASPATLQNEKKESSSSRKGKSKKKDSLSSALPNKKKEAPSPIKEKTNKKEAPSSVKEESNKKEAPTSVKDESNKKETPSSAKEDSKKKDAPSSAKEDSKKKEAPSSAKEDSQKKEAQTSVKEESNKKEADLTDSLESNKMQVESSVTVENKKEEAISQATLDSKEKESASLSKVKSTVKETASVPKSGTKRTVNNDISPPAKKARTTKESSAKKNSGFFIKLNNTNPIAKKTTVNKQRSKSQSPTTLPRVKGNSRLASSSPLTKATKFSRTQLIKNFGKRFFNSTVRIKRCKHPLMLTLECNARERKQQSKNKSKNLSVSFKEQVEIIDGSDTESNYSDENKVSINKSNNKIVIKTPHIDKKAENGEIIDDIELDSTTFITSDVGSNSSTPLRKKTEKKSYSPLKDDGSSSARSAKLKLANEKLPPLELRRLRDDDEEDDASEYIVPINVIDQVSSQENSNPVESTKSNADAPALNNADESEEKPHSLRSSLDSFTTATDVEKSSKCGENEKFVSLNDEVSIEKTSETKESLQIEKTEKSNDKDVENSNLEPNDMKHINGNETTEIIEIADSKDEDKESKNSQMSGLEENESVHLVLEIEPAAPTPTVSFPSDSQDDTSESIVKTVINKILIESPQLDNVEKEQSTTIKSINTGISTSISS